MGGLESFGRETKETKEAIESFMVRMIKEAAKRIKDGLKAFGSLSLKAAKFGIELPLWSIAVGFIGTKKAVELGITGAEKAVDLGKKGIEKGIEVRNRFVNAVERLIGRVEDVYRRTRDRLRDKIDDLREKALARSIEREKVQEERLLMELAKVRERLIVLQERQLQLEVARNGKKALEMLQPVK